MSSNGGGGVCPTSTKKRSRAEHVGDGDPRPRHHRRLRARVRRHRFRLDACRPRRHHPLGHPVPPPHPMPSTLDLCGNWNAPELGGCDIRHPQQSTSSWTWRRRKRFSLVPGRGRGRDGTGRDGTGRDGDGTGRDGTGRDGTAMEKSHPSEAETTSAVTVAQPPSGQVCDQLGKLVQAKAVMPDQVDQLPRLHEQPASVWRP